MALQIVIVIRRPRARRNTYSKLKTKSNSMIIDGHDSEFTGPKLLVEVELEVERSTTSTITIFIFLIAP